MATTSLFTEIAGDILYPQLLISLAGRQEETVGHQEAGVFGGPLGTWLLKVKVISGYFI